MTVNVIYVDDIEKETQQLDEMAPNLAQDSKTGKNSFILLFSLSLPHDL